MSSDLLKIVAVGDLSFNGCYDRILNRYGPGYPFRHVLPYWRDADLRLGNLESPPTSQPRTTPSKFTLRGSSRAIESLVDAGFQCLCLANNHMMDFGPGGLVESCLRATEAGIYTVGAGRNKADASEPAVLEIRGQNIGICAFCEVVQDSRLYAGPNTAGVVRWERDASLRSIEELRSKVDWLIVNMHWGAELTQLPSPAQRNCARALVEAGADLILGHHPHVLQPLEVIHRTPVAYSLGNFLFSSAFWRGRNDQGELFSSKFSLHPLTRKTGWLEVTLQRNASPQVKLHAALLDKSLCAVPDESVERAAEWEELHQRLNVADYAEEFNMELEIANNRLAWNRYDRTIGRHVELKLFEWGLLPWAVREA